MKVEKGGGAKENTRIVIIIGKCSSVFFIKTFENRGFIGVTDVNVSSESVSGKWKSGIITGKKLTGGGGVKQSK